MGYSRENPSPRYQVLIDQHRQMHLEGDKSIGIPPENTFEGMKVSSKANRIKKIVQMTGAKTILDYGSGKGRLHIEKHFKIPGQNKLGTLAEYWEVESVRCYDPCYPPYSELPLGKFDGVISIDVLEHCTEEDLPWIIDEIFNYANLFVYANIACEPALKFLPNGENAHATVRPADYWEAIFENSVERYPDLLWEVNISYRRGNGGRQWTVEKRLGNLRQGGD